ncbi:amidase [Novosphingobium sp. MW5]|nr:amidase [Novosphingobium sp. MW5]
MKHAFILIPALALAGCGSIPKPDLASAPANASQFVQRIDALDDQGPKIGAVIAINPDALRDAARAEALPGPLAGKTVLIKDNIETADRMPTTVGSLALKDNVTGRDAPLVAKLRAAGVVVLGKTNLSEWANIRGSRSSSGWSGVGGQTRNPHAIDRSPCGSSAGSGAAVAAGFAWAAIGTETDGSITCPASANGVVGLKPTVGLVSRRFIAPISASQDTAGPMTSTVKDAALLLTAMAGPDGGDPATARAELHMQDFAEGIDSASLSGLRVGVMRRAVGNHPGVMALFEAALTDMKNAGAVLVDIDWEPEGEMYRDESTVLRWELKRDLTAWLKSLPGNPPVRSLSDVIAWNKANAPQELRWFGQDTFEAADRMTDEAAYKKARENSLRLAGREGIDMLLAKHKVSLLVFPTEGPAWSIDLITGGASLPGVGMGSLPAIAGYPHLSVPMGTVENLPVGLSIVAAQWADKAVLDAGAAYERARTAPLAKPSFKRWGE